MDTVSSRWVTNGPRVGQPASMRMIYQSCASMPLVPTPQANLANRCCFPSHTCSTVVPGAGLAALLGAGVFGVGPGYLPEEDRAEYAALSGGDRESGMVGELSPTAAAPAGTL